MNNMGTWKLDLDSGYSTESKIENLKSFCTFAHLDTRFSIQYVEISLIPQS